MQHLQCLPNITNFVANWVHHSIVIITSSINSSTVNENTLIITFWSAEMKPFRTDIPKDFQFNFEDFWKDCCHRLRIFLLIFRNFCFHKNINNGVGFTFAMQGWAFSLRLPLLIATTSLKQSWRFVMNFQRAYNSLIYWLGFKQGIR